MPSGGSRSISACRPSARIRAASEGGSATAPSSSSTAPRSARWDGNPHLPVGRRSSRPCATSSGIRGSSTNEPEDGTHGVRLSGRRALVAGASQGFGLEVARAFLQEGAYVTVCARDGDRLEQAREDLAAFIGDPARVLAVPTDVSAPDQVCRLVETAASRFGGLDILVCNAAIHGPKGPVADVDWTEWVRAIEVNLLGTVLLCRHALAHFLPRRYGKIILLSGGGATKARPYLSAYAASKAAIVR